MKCLGSFNEWDECVELIKKEDMRRIAGKEICRNGLNSWRKLTNSVCMASRVVTSEGGGSNGDKLEGVQMSLTSRYMMV